MSSDSSVLLPNHDQDQDQSNRNGYLSRAWISDTLMHLCPSKYPPDCHASSLHPYFQYTMMNKESNIFMYLYICDVLSCPSTTCWFFSSSSTSPCLEPGSHIGHGNVLLCPCEHWGSPCAWWFLALYTVTRLAYLPFSFPPQYLSYDSEGGFVSLFSLSSLYQSIGVGLSPEICKDKTGLFSIQSVTAAKMQMCSM